MAKKITPAAKPAAKPSSIRAKFSAMRSAMDSSLIERHEEIDMVLTALIAQEHPLLVGPPGTAKSLLLDTLATWMDSAAFNLCVNRYTTAEEVFGPVSVVGLKNDQYRRITTGKLPEATFAFLDEIFKASSAILNTMLRILNERLFENGDGKYVKCPLLICVAASNEWPSEGELGALFDRFLFRKSVAPIGRANRERLLFGRVEPAIEDRITREELQIAHEEARRIPWSEAAREGMLAILEALNAAGIQPGDRRMRKSVFAVQCFAYLNGAEEVELEHLDILRHTLWSDPEQAVKTGTIVGKLANPIGTEITDLLMQADSVVASSRPADSVPKLQNIQAKLTALGNHPRRQPAIQFLGELIGAQYKKVVGI